MVAAVSRDDSKLAGGISSGKLLPQEKLVVEPLAWLTPDGIWKDIDCHGTAVGCRNFEKTYLSKPHTYTVVSADGRGATVKAAPTSLGDCWGYSGDGTSDLAIRDTAIAASSPAMFTPGTPAKRLTDEEAAPIRKALSALVPTKLDSTAELRIYSINLEGRNFYVVERAYQDYASKPGYDPVKDTFKFVFAIGTLVDGHFDLLHRNKYAEDENELVVGTIHLKSGKDFLITTVNDTESQIFHVYGVRNGRLSLIYSGGGSSC